MKTIEEKAEAYDKVFRTAQELYNNPASSQIGKDWICAIFPELKESEDEKIKKEIISHLKYLGKYCQESMPNVNEWITWIEKQGEQKPADMVDPKFKVKYAGNEYNVFEVKDIAGVTYYGIEDEPNHIDYVLPDNCEIVSEQKLADKVEPKFHKDDWIIHQGTENVYQVIAIIDNQYQLKYGDNYTVQKCSDVDRCARLWDISKDAKDGDVLQLGLVTAIFQEYIGNGKCKCYCSICGEFCIPSQDGDDNSYGCSDAAPATKEQRDILLKAIDDAGYTFDFEKKDLKKIKQNLTWSEEDERNLQGIIDEIEANKHSAPDYDFATYDRFLSWLKSLKERYTWKPSNEQIVALEHFVRSIWESEFASPYNNNIKLVYLLLNQLKKLKGE